VVVPVRARPVLVAAVAAVPAHARV
jgi:hypothetical protein